MTLQITVRGTAQQVFPAEVAAVAMAVAVEGDNKEAVAGEAAEVQGPLIEQVKQLAGLGAISRWDAGQVRIYSHRPYQPDGTRGPLVHAARLDVNADFIDFERLSGFVDFWSGRDHIHLDEVSWDLEEKNRRACQAEVRRAAVEDAIAKAQGYANAVRRGRVVAVEFADPGMLSDSNGGFDHGGPQPMMASRMKLEAASGGPEVTVTPEEITVYAAVDARFTTEG